MAPPVLIASCQATAIASVSNVLAQFLEAHRNRRPFVLDGYQLLNFAIVSILTAPPNYYWQMFLERSLPGRKRIPSNRFDRAKFDAMDMEERATDEEKYKEMNGEDSFHEHETTPLSIKNTFAKWVIDCWTLGALFNTVIFLLLLGMLKGKTNNELLSSIRSDTIPIIIASYKFWPFASVINFSLIPVEKRIVFLSSCALVWNVWLSLFAAKV